ncbi:hypothetical protein Tco_1182525 [Tanacetum coccineum]
METVKFKAPPLVAGPAENQNKNKFCEFHRDKGHNTDEYIHLRRQIKEAVKSGQLSHLVKQIKQRGRKGEQAKAAKKGEAPNKEKATTIFMVMADKKTNCDRRGSRGTSHPPYVYGWGIGLRSDVRALLQQIAPEMEEGILTIRNNTIIPAEYRMVAEALSRPPP